MFGGIVRRSPFPVSSSFWCVPQVAVEVTVDAGAHMEGILLVHTAVLFKTLSSLNGRVLAQTACDLQIAAISQPVA
jgi:hypothetical protein